MKKAAYILKTLNFNHFHFRLFEFWTFILTLLRLPTTEELRFSLLRRGQQDVQRRTNPRAQFHGEIPLILV